jgi:hypothetical protein
MTKSTTPKILDSQDNPYRSRVSPVSQNSEFFERRLGEGLFGGGFSPPFSEKIELPKTVQGLALLLVPLGSRY